MTAFALLTDAQAELLSGGSNGGYGPDILIKEITKNRTSIRQRNAAINVNLGIALRARNVVNAGSIGNTQVNSVG